MKFDAKFELDVLSQVLRDTKFLKRAARTLDSYHFANRAYGYIWRVIKGCWDSHKETPTPEYMLHRVNSEFTEPEDRVRHVEALKGLIRKRSEIANVALDEMTDFVRLHRMHKGIEKAIKAIEDDDVDGSYQVISDIGKNDHKPRDYVKVDWIEQFKDRQAERIYAREHPDEFVVIPTGIKGLDNIIKGIKIGELGLVLATTGKGKSITLSNIGYASAARGFNTVYFALEMGAAQVAQRIDSRWSGYEYDKFKNAEFTLEDIQVLEARHQKVYEKFQNKLKIISMPLRKCTISTIRNILDDLEEEDDFRPQCIIMDSGDHMTSESNYKEHRLQQGENFVSLKDLAMEGYAVWSAAQAGRDVADKIATAESLADSYEKARIADMIFSINTPQNQTRSTKDSDDYSFLGDEFAGAGETDLNITGQHLELFLAKHRDGQSKISIPLDVDFSRMLVRSAEEEGGEY